MSGIKVNQLPTQTSPSLTDYTINDTASTTTERSTWQKIKNLFQGSDAQASGITAAGTIQGDATTISKDFNRVDTVASGTGVVNAATETAGFARTVQNNGANDLNWYPYFGSAFYIIGSGAMSANAPIVIASGNQASVRAYANGVLTII